MSTTPTAAMETLLGLEPLHLSIEAEALRSAYRMGDDVLRKATNLGHSAIFRKLKTVEPMGSKADRIKTLSISVPFRTYVLNEGRDGGETPSAITGNSIWYTEGIKTASGTGAGIVEKGRTGERITLNQGTTTTAFQANILAITNCSRKMKERAYTRKHITIVTGDEATIKALESYTSGHNVC
ncbi:uncharacterized protein LOC125504160 [Dendroctonus ponderosae]|uniref:uncharacterized protein LOC125504160 n=1 Tax=Dendroctonus ponderosae TaxID=77166 RepID=UPI002035D71F|nr:uncharacterized protein LOC125504160 [Dendroctonus ponderosae]